ncbi:AAA family ATPase [Actinomadura alba]|uniref:AAA family ATPase n=1 Tax=Actinomadura alba TaxID=406431 RepID=A0ABR7LWY2_9ACTN|nr:MoxR family ATPase [Actinomadura alba]MBC6469367.1 AAA family ATPase [Actinomadura alba]
MSADERPGAPSAYAQNGAGGTPAEPVRPGWWIYRGTGRPLRDIELSELLPPPPPWRAFDGGPARPAPPHDDGDLDRRLGALENLTARQPARGEVEAVNAAMFLRRPLLVTGKPGVGKSSLAYQITRELRLGRVLRWSISSRSTLREGLYEYDAIGRAQDAATARQLVEARPEAGEPPGSSIGDYVQLGPLGTALLPYRLPRVLLIDELDKSDIDLPNDLLDVFEEGEYRIPALTRVAPRERDVEVHTADPDEKATVTKGHVRCKAFPIIIITSNGEREFPPAFMRRCIQFSMEQPDENGLASLVAAHFTRQADAGAAQMIQDFMEYRRVHHEIAADQLLNAFFLATSGAHTQDASWKRLLDLVWQRLSPEAAPE